MAEISKELLAALTKTGGVTELVKLARENGIDVPEGTENEFYEKIMALKDKMPLTDEDLDAVAGGMAIRKSFYRPVQRPNSNK